MASAPATSAPDRPDAFISYSRRDAAFVETRLAAALEARGKDLWIDVDDIRGGATDWRATVYAGIEASRVVIFVLSPDSLQSRVCADELEQAVALNKRIIPVLRRPVDGLPIADALSRPNWISVRDEDDFDGALAKLLAAVENDEAWLDRHARLTQRTIEWLRAARDPSFLLRGSDLRAAEQWLDEQGEHAQAPTADQVAYINAGRRAAGRRQRLLLGGVLLALAISVALGIVANVERRGANAQALAARAIDAARRDPEQALRLAIEARGLRDTALVSRALREAVAAAGWTRILRTADPRPVTGTDVSPDGTRAVTAGEGSSATVWDLRRGRAVATLRHRHGPLRTARFSPDGRRIVTAGGDGSARLWDLRGHLQRVLRPVRAGDVWSAAFDRSGRRLLTATDGGAAQLWDLTRPRSRPLRLPGGADDYRAFTPLARDGRTAVTAGAGGRVRVWTLARGARRPLVLPPPAAASAVTVLELAPDGRRLLAGYDSGRACLWTLAHATPRRCTTQGDTIASAQFSADGRRFVTASTDGTAILARTRDGRRLALLHETAPVNTVSLSDDGSRIVTASEDRLARIWTRSGQRQATLRGHTDAVLTATFSRDGRTVLTGSADGSARVWAAGDAAATLPGAPLREADVAFSPDSRRLLAVDRRGRAAVWEPARGQRIDLQGAMVSNEAEQAPCDRYTGCGPWSADGRSIAGVDSRGEATVWDARSGAARPLGIGAATGAAFMPGGTRVVVLGSGAARIVSAASGTVLARVPRRSAAAITRVRFTRDGMRLLTVADDGTVAAWDVASGRRVGPSRRADAPGAAAISPDGARLAVGAASGDVRLAALPGRRSRTLRQHLDLVSNIAFDARGDALVIASEDGSASVWEAGGDGTRPAAVLRGSAERLRTAEFSTDGRFVLTAALGSGARLWDPALETTVLSLTKGRFGAARLSPDERYIALGGAGTVQLRRCELCAPSPELVRIARSRLPPG